MSSGISNESHNEYTKWQYHMIDFIRRYEKKKKYSHPVVMTVQWPDGDNNVLWNSAADADSPNPVGGFRDAPPVADGRKVTITDTDHLWGIGGNYAWVWKSFLMGLNPILMDPYRTDILKYDKAKPDWELIRRNMGYTRGFANRINLNSMLPRPDLAASGYCLAAQGEEYLVYAPRRDKVTVDLSNASREYFVKWFDPLTGKSIQGSKVKGGTIQFFPSPFAGDAVLHLRRRSIR